MSKMLWRDHLTDREWLDTIDLWHGGNDTFDIAKRFNVRESFIYNRLPLWREKYLPSDEKQA